jgi:Na+-transporting methylmalonyl-CoA/oxaloacetate decarboxylase gamma subunit
MWGEALKIFVFGFCGVFITLSILVIAIKVLGACVKLIQGQKS